MSCSANFLPAWHFCACVWYLFYPFLILFTTPFLSLFISLRLLYVHSALGLFLAAYSACVRPVSLCSLCLIKNNYNKSDARETQVEVNAISGPYTFEGKLLCLYNAACMEMDKKHYSLFFQSIELSMLSV